MNQFIQRCRRQWWTLCFPLLVGALLSAQTTPARAQTIQGFAELHSHLMAEHSFGGSWYWGTVEGPIEWALRRCDGNPLQSHAAIEGLPGVAEFIAADTGIHLGKRRGYDRRRCKKVFGITIPGTCPKPHFEGWPRHDGLAHQQMWNGHVRQAFDNGMKVMVVSLAESNFLCRNTPSGKRKYNCDEMASVHRQIDRLNQFVNNHDWVGIARSPAEARLLASQNKLALVIAVEISKLFPHGDFISQLDELYDKGVRSVQLVHHHDNRFSGAAPIPRLVQTVGLAEAIKGEMSPINDVSCGSNCDGDTRLNTQGLTSDGAALVNAMMDRGMLVDVAHTSRKSLQQVHAILAQRDNYPMFYSHAHLFDSIDGNKDQRNEKYIKTNEIAMINGTSGMVGLRTGLEAANTYGTAVSNYCDGSVRSFAQSLMAGVDQGLSIGFGADLNGFITQMRPRCYPNGNPGSDTVQKKGLAHIGLLPEVIIDLQNVGVPQRYIDHLNSSAERFVVMWERAIRIANSD